MIRSLTGNDVVSDDILDEFGIRLGAERFHYAVLVICNRSCRHQQDAPDFLHYLAFDKQLQHFPLPLGEVFIFVDEFFSAATQTVDFGARQGSREMCLAS